MARFKIGDRIQAEHTLSGMLTGTVTGVLDGEPLILLIRNDEDENIYTVQANKASLLKQSTPQDKS